MTRALVAGMLVMVALCVASSLAGIPVLAFSASLGGIALLAVAVEHSRPTHGDRAEIEHGRRRHD